MIISENKNIKKKQIYKKNILEQLSSRAFYMYVCRNVNHCCH